MQMMTLAGSGRRWWATAMVAACGIAIGGVCGPTQGADVESLIAPDAAVVVYAPSLKRTSDDLSHLMEAMDLGQFTLGGRPIDQFKAQLGITGGFDERGGMAVVMRMKADAAGDGPAPPRELMDVVLLLPVTDASTFVDSLEAHENGTYSPPGSAGLGRFFVRQMDSHVAMSNDEAALGAYEPGEGIGRTLAETLGDRWSSLRDRGDVFVYVSAEGMGEVMRHWRWRIEASAGRLGDNGGPLNPADPADQAVRVGRWLEANALDGFAGGAAAVEIDPLGVALRTLIRYEPGSEAAGLFSGGEPAGGALSRVEDETYYLAGAFDMRGMNGEVLLTRLAEGLGWPVPRWMVHADVVDLMVSPSEAGLSGGLLNDAFAVLRTRDPQYTFGAFREFVRGLGEPGGRIEREVTWEDRRSVRDVGEASAYEVRATRVPPELAMPMGFVPYLVGPSGWRGFATPIEDGLVVTFSRRPAVLAKALRAGQGSDRPLGADPTIRALQQWLPAEPDVQMYLGVEHVMDLVGEVARVLGGRLGGASVDGRVEPLAIGVAVDSGAVESAVVAPAGIIKLMYEMSGGDDLR